MKKIIMFLFLFFGFIINASATNYDGHSIDEINLSVKIPSNYYIFTRNISEDDSNLSKFEMAKDDMIDYLNGLNAYMVATTEDTSYSIYVTMNEDEYTNNYYDLKDVSSEVINGLGDGYVTGIDVVGDNVNKYNIYENNQAIYIQFEYELKDIYDEYSYNLKYKTIKNGKDYTIYLRKLAPITTEDKEMMKEVIDSVKFLQANTQSSNNNLFTNIIGIILFIGFIAMFIIKPKKRTNT